MFIQSISIKLAKTDSNNVLADIFNGFKSPGNLIRWLGYNYKYSGDNHCVTKCSSLEFFLSILIPNAGK